MYMTYCDKNPLELVSEIQKESERREIVWCIGANNFNGLVSGVKLVVQSSKLSIEVLIRVTVISVVELY